MNKKVCILGLGYIGLPTAGILSKNGYNVYGVDLIKSKVNAINSGECYISEPKLKELIFDAVKNKKLKAGTKPIESDIFIIAVPTPFHNQYVPNIDYVINAIESIISVIKKGNIIIIESTIPVGTTDKVEKLLLKNGIDISEIYIAHCPERVLPGNILYEIINNDRIVGATTEIGTKEVTNFYKSFVKGEILTTDAKTAEMAKLTENSFRDVNIAFANELSIICDKENINIWELIELSNKHPRVNILNPGSGVGGHCIAVDPWFIINLNKKDSKIIKTARKINLHKTEWVTKKIENEALKFEKKFNKKPKIACMGLAYKADIDDLRESPSIKIVNNLINNDFEVIVVEPNVKNHPNLNIVSIKKALDQADVIAWLVPHTEFKKLNMKTGLDFCGILVK